MLNNSPTRRIVHFLVTFVALATVSMGQEKSYLGSSAGDEFGASVSRAGDVNGDGVEDFIVGAARNDRNGVDAGNARVYCGFSGRILMNLFGGMPGDEFGWSVSHAGDVNGDGYGDVIVGALQRNTGNGYATVFSGEDGKPMMTFVGSFPADHAAVVGAAGDVNGDGYDDLLVGAYLSDSGGVDSGELRIYSGVDGAQLLHIVGDAAGDQFGRSVAGIGDVDGDGHGDFVVGADRNSGQAPLAGLARVYSGRTGTPLFTFEGQASGDRFGGSVGAAGDPDQDGIPDLIVGATQFDSGGTGFAQVLSGRTGNIVYEFHGDSVLDEFGFSVAGAEDVNGDGANEVIVGAPGDDDQGSQCGMVRIFSGMDGSTIDTHYGASAGDLMGVGVAGLDDLDANGFAEYLAGSRGDDRRGADSGSVSLFGACPDFNELFGNCAFEAGRFTNWTIEYAKNDNCNSKPSQWTAVLPAGHPKESILDVNTVIPPGQSLDIDPFEGVFSARLNFDGVSGGSHATRISQIQTLGENHLSGGSILGVQWGAVLEDPGHQPGCQPYFEIQVRADGSPPLASFFATATDAANGGWQNIATGSTPWYYKKGLFEVDLADHIGAEIEVSMTVADCTLSGHGSYALLDDVCMRRCTPPQDGLVGWWSDHVLIDRALSNHGIWGNVFPAPGYVGNLGIGFNGTNIGLVPDDPSLNFGPASSTGDGDFSIDAWIFAEEVSGIRGIVKKGHFGPAYAFFVQDALLRLALWDGSGLTVFTLDEPSIPTNEWMFVAVTVDRDNIAGGQFYVNGVPVGGSFDPTVRSLSLNNIHPLEIGGMTEFYPHFQGRLDEVEVFNRALTASEIASIFRAGKAGKCREAFVPNGSASPQ
ncbi:MAG: hypothetical protein DWQ01_10970 [Planctomycetota bacterium]|nr:MAG: hypothetical protein DWQ01_10970 [Planctomycetota bacterium]